MASASTHENDMRDEGFSLLEVLVAVLLAATVAAGTLDLFSVSLAAIRDAREESSATSLALQKLEQLRGAASAPAMSADNALDVDTPGFVDRVDASGQPASASGPPARSTVYVRRWSVRPLPSDPARGLVLRVFVTSARRDAVRGTSLPRSHSDVLLTTVRMMR
jgi:prepilin-type N-terminal cleavage/methylation domain-containing protein